jgi:hypothetical protein
MILFDYQSECLLMFISFLILFTYLLTNNKYSNLPGPSLNFFQRIFMYIQYTFLLTVPEFAEYWLSKFGKTVGVFMLKNYTILTADRNFIREVLNGPCSKNFVNRMGHSEGLSKIGMYNNGVIWNNDKVKWKMSREAFEKNFSHKFLEQAADIAALKMKQEMTRLKMSDRAKLHKNGCLNYEIDLLNFFRRVTLSVVLEVFLYLFLKRLNIKIITKSRI